MTQACVHVQHAGHLCTICACTPVPLRYALGRGAQVRGTSRTKKRCSPAAAPRRRLLPASISLTSRTSRHFVASTEMMTCARAYAIALAHKERLPEFRSALSRRPVETPFHARIACRTPARRRPYRTNMPGLASRSVAGAPGQAAVGSRGGSSHQPVQLPGEHGHPLRRNVHVERDADNAVKQGRTSCARACCAQV